MSRAGHCGEVAAVDGGDCDYSGRSGGWRDVPSMRACVPPP